MMATVRVLALVLAAMALLLPATARAQGGAGEAPPEKSDPGGEAPREWNPPQPKLPEVKIPPAGAPPAGWQSWATGQRIVKSERVSLSFGLGGIAAASGDGVSGFDQNAYSEITRPLFVLYLEAGFSLMPFLNIYAGFGGQVFGNGHLKHTGFGLYARTDGLSAMLIYLGVRLKLPIRLIGPRLFRVADAECGYGFVPYVKFGAGIARLSEMMATQTDPTWNEFDVYQSTTNFSFTFGLGAEYRWRRFGMYLEFFASNLGSPQPISGSTYNPDSIMTFNLFAGLAIYI
jgi:hypothetical protein